MAERDELVASIAKTTADYRGGIVTCKRVEEWVRQFDDAVQLPILREMDYVLKRTYFSYTRTKGVLTKLLLEACDNPYRFWRGVKFLRIQSQGDSQKYMLQLLDEILQDKFGFRIDDCGDRPHSYAYVDDAVYTGKRIRDDMKKWIKENAPSNASICVITIALHSKGKDKAEEEIQMYSDRTRKKVRIYWHNEILIENRHRLQHESDVYWPTECLHDHCIKKFVEKRGYIPILRNGVGTGSNRFFSSIDGRNLLESEYLKAGVRIWNYHNVRYSEDGRILGPMGFTSDFHDVFGVGSPLVTFQNCPNNAPLALWGDASWTPLFLRKKNRDKTHYPHAEQEPAGSSIDKLQENLEYDPNDCAVFHKVVEEWGGLSNMSSGFPLRVNGENIRTSEALYQACRFPSRPDIQWKIISERSPMAAKMCSKLYRGKHCRQDWIYVQEEVMWWCLKVKLAQNFQNFGDVLQRTGIKNIVERSNMDDFWGAKLGQDGMLRGKNRLGRLLVELRYVLRYSSEEVLAGVKPPEIKKFLLFGKPTEVVYPASNKLSLFE